MSGPNRNFQNMDLNFDLTSSHIQDLNRRHVLYDDSKYNGNRHFTQYSEQINYNQPCQEGSKEFLAFMNY